MANSDYTHASNGAFAPICELATDIDELFDVVNYNNLKQENAGGLAVGSLVLLDDEIISVTDLFDGVMVVKRGCFDTIPAAHQYGAVMFVLSTQFVSSDLREYLGTETISLKVLPRTGSATVPVNYAAPLSITFNQRFERPYPPAQVKVNGQAWTVPTTLSSNEPMNLTWVGRNRVLQADVAVGHSDANVSPEPGTSYTLKLFNESDVHVATRAIPLSQAFTYTVTNAVVDLSLQSILGQTEPYSARAELHSVRDGLSSMVGYSIPFSVNLADAGAPYDIHYANVALLVRFDSLTGGVFTDESVLAHTLTNYGTPTVTTTGAKFTGSVAFDGASGIVVPASPAFDFGTGDFTVAFWLKTDDGASGTAVNPRIICPGITTNGTNGFQLWLRNSTGPAGTVQWSNAGGTDVVVGSTNPVNDGEWHHVEFSRGSSVARCFVDGVLQGSAAHTEALTRAGTEGFNIGKRPDNNALAFLKTGTFIDDLQITKGVCRHTASFTPPTIPAPAGQTGLDPDWSNVALLLNFDGVADNSTVFTDLSPVVKTVTNSSAVIRTNISRFGSGSLSLTSSGRRLIITSHADFDFAGDFTLELSAYFTSSQTAVLLNRATGTSFYPYQIWISGGKLGARFFGADTGTFVSLLAGTAMTLSTWHDIALTRSGDNLVLYDNGVAVASGTITGPLYANTNNITIGSNSDGAAGFVGNIDDVRITKGVARTITQRTLPFPLA